MNRCVWMCVYESVCVGMLVYESMFVWMKYVCGSMCADVCVDPCVCGYVFLRLCVIVLMCGCVLREAYTMFLYWRTIVPRPWRKRNIAKFTSTILFSL